MLVGERMSHPVIPVHPDTTIPEALDHIETDTCGRICKRDFMPLMYSPADLEAMAKVKRVWNPDGLLNPGKIFPTSKSCVEVGAAGKPRDINYKPHRIELEGKAQRF